MVFEDEGIKEKLSGGSPRKSTSKMTLQKAIDMGEYDPEYLSTFPEWHNLSPNLQFQYIREGLDNRRKHLTVQWSEITNVLDFSLKPHLKTAIKNIEKQLKKLDKDWEKLYLKYSFG